MAIPQVTTASIREHAPSFVTLLGRFSLYPGGSTRYDDTPEEERNQLIQARGNEILNRLEPHLEQLSSPQGMYCRHLSHPSKIHIGWHYSERTHQIKGIFISIYQENPYNTGLEAFKLQGGYGAGSHFQASPVIPTGTQRRLFQNKDLMRSLFISSIFSEEGPQPCEEFSFNAQWLDNDSVRPFYDNNQEFLNHLITPPTPEQPETNYRKYFYLCAASLLLLTGVAYFASKYFSEDAQKPTLSMN